jgi:hypothetical protein
MSRNRRCLYLLGILFVLVLALRLYLAFQSPNFQVGDAYFTYRQVDSIRSSFMPTYFDGLSFSGRVRIFPPAYYYLLSAFSFVFGTALTLKIMPNVLACSLIVIIYFMVFELTRKRGISLFSAAASAFIPVFFGETVNSASRLSFTLPLIFYLMYCFMRIKERPFLYQFLILSFVLSLTSAISFLLVFALLIYLLLVKLEYKTHNRAELESIIFVTFLTLWVNVLIYKKAFLFHSYSLIWQNMPSQVLDSYFRQADVFLSITNVGILPLLFGIYAVYKYMFKERDKRTYLLMAFALAVALLLWFRLITLEVGLMFLGAILVPLLAQSLDILFSYVEKTKIAAQSRYFWIPIALVFVLTSVIPAVAYASDAVKHSVGQEEMDALLWLERSTPQDSVVLSTIDEGDMVAAIARRRNVVDDDFLLVRGSDDVFDDVGQMYTSILKTRAVELMNKYGVDYVYISPRAKAEFGIEDLKYADKDCFELVYDSSGVKIYKSLCEVSA